MVYVRRFPPRKYNSVNVTLYGKNCLRQKIVKSIHKSFSKIKLTKTKINPWGLVTDYVLRPLHSCEPCYAKLHKYTNLLHDFFCYFDYI